MKPVALALGWVGYTLAYFGVCSLRGPGVGLFDLVIPGRTVMIPTGNKSPSYFTPGGGPGGSTITPTPGGGTNIVPGPGVNAPQPGTTLA